MNGNGIKLVGFELSTFKDKWPINFQGYSIGKIYNSVLINIKTFILNVDCLYISYSLIIGSMLNVLNSWNAKTSKEQIHIHHPQISTIFIVGMCVG